MRFPRIVLEARQLPFVDHFQNPLEPVGGVGRDRIGLRDAHHAGDVPLPDVLDQEQLDRLTLTRAEIQAGRVEVFDVVQRIGDPVRPMDSVYVLGFIQRPESFQMLEQRPEHSDCQQRQEPTRSLPRPVHEIPVVGTMG